MPVKAEHKSQRLSESFAAFGHMTGLQPKHTNHGYKPSFLCRTENDLGKSQIPDVAIAQPTGDICPQSLWLTTALSERLVLYVFSGAGRRRSGGNSGLDATRGIRTRPDPVGLPMMPRAERPSMPKDDETRSSANPPSNNGVRVLLVDNRDLIREGLCALIDQQPGFAVVGQAGNIDGAKNLEVTADVIVIDIDLPETRHFEVVSALRGHFPESALLVLTLVKHPAEVQSALALGADGYMLLTATSNDLFIGIRALAAGNTYLQPLLGVELARWHRSRESGLRLSSKEEQVLRCIALGHTNAEAAEQIGVSVRTVETHRARIHQKLGRRTRAELVEDARNLGLLDRDPQ